ncbi:MAG: hypothetical protein J5I90_10680 [Caldilineales bacterium]|nr:hypothetical protein [Caldilineales bacterium]
MNRLNAEERLRQDRILNAQYGQDSPASRAFDRARSKVFLNDIVAFLRGYQNQLLAFDSVYKDTVQGERRDLGLMDVPLDAIRGSVDRFREFDQVFLPKHEGLRDRWSRVATAREQGLPMPPIEVFKLGDVYFVRDGHHRVSVCRARGDSTILAHVVELTANASVGSPLGADELPMIDAYADFLNLTEADDILPGVDLTLSYPNLYARLVRHIALFRYLNRSEDEEPREWPEAVRAWYEQLYLPILTIIEENEVMSRFPDRTPTDLYLWLVTHFRRLHRHLPRPDEIDNIEDRLHDYLTPFLS